jgi:hypothetical protein
MCHYMTKTRCTQKTPPVFPLFQSHKSLDTRPLSLNGKQNTYQIRSTIVRGLLLLSRKRIVKYMAKLAHEDAGSTEMGRV